MEDIKRISGIPVNNLSMEDHTIIGRILSNPNNFIVRNEFNEELYESLKDLDFEYLNRTEPIHREENPPRQRT